MQNEANLLFGHEVDIMLESLRRDMRNQLQLAQQVSDSKLWHEYNARITKRILETLNPKQAREHLTERTIALTSSR